jgi:hypothetical protein
LSKKELASDEKIRILSDAVFRNIAIQAAMVMPLIEKYGDEAKEHVKKELRKAMVAYYRKKLDSVKAGKRDLETFNKLFMDEIMNSLIVMGQTGGVILEKTGKKLVTKDTKCTVLDAWRVFTDKPEVMCEIDSEIEKAMAEAVNPNLVYTQYSGPKIRGKTQWGLPWGKACCEFIVEAKD